MQNIGITLGTARIKVQMFVNALNNSSVFFKMKTVYALSVKKV